MTKKMKLISGVLFFALMFAHFSVNVYSTLARLKGSYDGWTERMLSNSDAQIGGVDQNGPATALQVGDEFVSINGLTLRDDPEILKYNLRVPPGASYRIVVRRSGASLEFTITTVGYPISYWFRLIASRLTQLLFLLTGLAVFLLKPADRQAWLLAFMLGAFAGMNNPDPQSLPLAMKLVAAMARIMFWLSLPVFSHFFLIFPDRSPLLRRFPNLERRLYWPFFLGLPCVYFDWLAYAFRVYDRWAQFSQGPWTRWIVLLSFLIVLAYLPVGLAALLVGYRAAGVVARRKLHVVVAGSGAGFLNVLLVFAWDAFLQARLPGAGDWIYIGSSFTLPLIPLSFAYAIVRHNVIPVSLIISRSARYVLVSRGAILLDMIAAGLSVTAVLTYIFSRMRLPVIVIGLISAAVGVVAWKVASGLHARYLRPLIDRRFFRQSYDAHQIIAELTGSLRTVTGLPQLLELVATRIQTALQTVNVTVFLRDRTTGNYNSAYSRDYSETDGRAIGRERRSMLPWQAGLLKRLSDNVEPLDVEQYFAVAQQGSDNGNFRDAENGGPIDSNSPESPVGPMGPVGPTGPIGPNDEIESLDEIEALQEVKSTLLMPLYSKYGMLGVISLGPRLGDLPFSREDKQLLMSVSGPTALAIENARLVEQMVAEARRLQEIEGDHRRKTEELAFARQLQLSMLPTRNVSLDNIEIVGRMRAATEVGGDYYDFIEMVDGRVCVAVGDATGHGMAAGLVVGMVKMGLIHALQGGLQQVNYSI